MTEHYCEEHQTKFFKTARMRGYSHPVEGEVNPETGKQLWCNEGDQETYHSPHPDAEKVAKLEPVKPDPVPPQPNEVLPAPAPQAVGMMTKEIGDMIRAKMLTTLFGATIKNELVKWYRGQTLGITRINYDGKDLPEYKVE